MRLMLCLILSGVICAYIWPNSSPRPAGLPCPAINVVCPETVESGQPVTFTASMRDIDWTIKPSYKWTVSAGTIIEGQGSTSITVDTTGIIGAETITATVEVEGLDSRCSPFNKASCSMIVTPRCILVRLFDQYGDIPFKDEEERLDNFALEVKSADKSKAYIIAYAGRRTWIGEAVERANRARKYLIRKHDLEQDRVVIIDGGYRENMTVELWVLPSDASPPTPSPTLQPSDVEIIEKPMKRKSTDQPNQ